MSRNWVKNTWAAALAMTAFTALTVAGAGPAAAADMGTMSTQGDCSVAPWDWDDCWIEH